MCFSLLSTCDILHLFPYKRLWLFASLRVLWPKQLLVLQNFPVAVSVFLFQHGLCSRRHRSCFWFCCLHVIFRRVCWKQSEATLHAKVCSLVYNGKNYRDVCLRSIISVKYATQNIFLSFYSKMFGKDISNGTAVPGKAVCCSVVKYEDGNCLKGSSTDE